MTPQELHEARRKLGLSQTALGEAIGLSRAAISLMERAQRPIETRTDYAIRWLLHEAGLSR